MSDNTLAHSAEEIPNVQINASLSALLSRLAAAQGHAVPAHRFEFVQHSIDGIAIDDLSVFDKLIELWRSRFAGMVATKVVISKATPNDFPLLWVASKSSDVFLVRGRLGADRLLIEQADGSTSEESLQQLVDGVFLHLAVDAPVYQDGVGSTRSASDWFAAAVRAHRGIFAEAMLATFMISSIGLASAMYTMQVYDRVVPTKGYSTLLVLTVGVLIAIALELMMKQVRAHMVDRACKAIDQDLSSIFFGKALDIRLDARPKTVGTFASQIRHFESVRNFMTSSTLFIFADAPFALFFIIVIALIGGPVALVPVVMVPIAVLIGLAFRKPIEKYTAEHMDESNRKNGLLIEAIDGVESIKSVSGEWKMLDRWRDLTATIARSEIKMRAVSSLSTNLTQTMQQISYAGMITVGAYLITQGDLTMGALIACSIIGGRALAPLAQVPNLIVQWKQAKIALDVLDNIMALPGEREAGRRLVVPEGCEGKLGAEKLGFGYVPEVPVLQVESLEIKPGERVAILGAIGSGKTSLIKLLGGFYQAGSGRVFLDSVDITHLAPEFVREHIGYLPQDVRLFNGTLRENITLGLPAPSDEQILAACKLTGLEQVIQSHPQGLEREISEGGRGLSGGQRQLVGLTRMLLASPSVLLLDEPTASMDAQSEMRVMRHLFQQIPRTSTLVIVTHKVAILPHVDRIIVVDKGRIVLDGPREAILEALKKSESGTSQNTPSPTQKSDSSNGWVTELKN